MVWIMLIAIRDFCSRFIIHFDLQTFGTEMPQYRSSHRWDLTTNLWQFSLLLSQCWTVWTSHQRLDEESSTLTVVM
jgi:hypothetical protein